MSATRTRNKLADLGAVAAGLAHEIRNPLNSLYINGQLLEEMISELPEGGVPQKQDLLSLARANLKVTQRLNDTLSGFLRFARPPAMELALVDLNRVVSETLRFLEIELAYREISLKTKLHPTALPILADEKLLKQALLNLLLNAQDAVDKEEKTIRVTTGVRAGRPFVRVRDNGRGIPASDRRRVFNTKLIFNRPDRREPPESETCTTHQNNNTRNKKIAEMFRCPKFDFFEVLH